MDEKTGMQTRTTRANAQPTSSISPSKPGMNKAPTRPMLNNRRNDKAKVGDLLVSEGLLTQEQLQKALAFQEKQKYYIPLGEACAKLNFISRANLNRVLKKFRQRILLGDLLLNLGLITNDQLLEALEKQRVEKRRLGEVLVRDGYISELTLLNAVSIQLGIPKIVPEPALLDRSILNLLPPDFYRKNEILPAFAKEGEVTVIMSNPLNDSLIAEMEKLLRMRVQPAVASPREIRSTLNRLFGFKEDEYIKHLERDHLVIDRPDLSFDEGENAVEAVNFIVTQAITEGASDIHLEPMADRLRVRYRIDGVMQHRTDFPVFLTPTIISRIKALCGVDVGERRRHQDGRIRSKFLDRSMDLRISTYVAMYGENVVIRLLDSESTGFFDLDQLGFTKANLNRFLAQLKHPTGIILVTGPTGSGKTTTLYSSINHLNHQGRVIITVEDPVELAIDGVVQAQINPRSPMNYTDYIKAMMRQDPDILMVGEIRDLECAEAVVQCALTGHKVLTTFHTDDTTGALLRLLDMGINTFLISSTIVSVCSQRLIRKLCLLCKEPVKPDKALLDQTTVKKEGLSNYEFYTSKGCPACNYTGFSGRTGIHELLVVNDEIRDAILDQQTSARIRMVSRESANLVSMMEDGFYKVLTGITSLEELLRKTAYHEVDMKMPMSADQLMRVCEDQNN